MTEIPNWGWWLIAFSVIGWLYIGVLESGKNSYTPSKPDKPNAGIERENLNVLRFN